MLSECRYDQSVSCKKFAALGNNIEIKILYLLFSNITFQITLINTL